MEISNDHFEKLKLTHYDNASQTLSGEGHFSFFVFCPMHGGMKLIKHTEKNEFLRRKKKERTHGICACLLQWGQILIKNNLVQVNFEKMFLTLGKYFLLFVYFCNIKWEGV